MTRQRTEAPDEVVLAFIAAVFPEAPDLARLAFDEAHVLKTATAELIALRKQRDEMPALSDAARRGLKYTRYLALSGLTDRKNDLLAFLDAVAPEDK
jgi:hypothetical protein